MCNQMPAFQTLADHCIFGCLFCLRYSTHEDIDQAFRIISEALTRAGFVQTLEDYKEIIANAWEGQRVHVEFVEAVHDVRQFVALHAWQTRSAKDKKQGVLIGLTTARYVRAP